MGYESRFYIVDNTSMTSAGADKTFALPIAIYDMCKMDYNGEVHRLIKNSPHASCFVYADDGDTPILIDRYDKELTDIDISQLIKALEHDNNGYRRIPPFLALLNAIIKEDWRDLKVLHYGY